MLAALVDKVSLGTPSTYRNLILTPILLKAGPLSSVEPLCIEEALAAATLRVSEVSAEGHVPELRVRNSGDTPVLILDGEELVGAKQNRIVNVTILVAPQSEVVIPVSCIEAGRWGYSRPSFAAAGRVLNPEIRYRKAEAVTRNLKEKRLRFSDQRAVWDGVDKMLYALGSASPTRALSDGFDERVNAISDFVGAFKLQPGQVGVLYRIGDVLAGLDLFASEHTFGRAFPKLARGSALQPSLVISRMSARPWTSPASCGPPSRPRQTASPPSASARSCASTLTLSAAVPSTSTAGSCTSSRLRDRVVTRVRVPREPAAAESAHHGRTPRIPE